MLLKVRSLLNLSRLLFSMNPRGLCQRLLLSPRLYHLLSHRANLPILRRLNHSSLLNQHSSLNPLSRSLCSLLNHNLHSLLNRSRPLSQHNSPLNPRSRWKRNQLNRRPHIPVALLARLVPPTATNGMQWPSPALCCRSLAVLWG